MVSWKPRVRSVLLLVNLSILILPLAGIGILRLYENALLRQTESELSAQAAFVSAAFKSALLRNYKHSTNKSNLQHYGIPLVDNKNTRQLKWRPQPPSLDLASDDILPPPPDPEMSRMIIQPAVLQAGEEITEIMKDAQQTTLAAIRVVDVNATIVASTGRDLHQSLASWQEVNRALSGEFYTVLRQRISDQPAPALSSISRGTTVRVFLASPVIHQGRILGAVILSRTPANIAQSLYKHRIELMIAGMILIGLVLAISAITALTITIPLEAVTRQAKHVANGESGPVTVLKKPVTYEVSELSQAVVQMAEHLDSRAHYIQNLAAQVSHAFKTPLTSMRGAIELLQDHPDNMPAEDRERFLKNLHKDAEYLNTLVQRLLELARADTIQADQSVSLLKTIVERVAERNQRPGLSVKISGQDSQVMINEDILETIIENLLDNARQHGGDKIDIEISELSDYSAKSTICSLKISDNGSGVIAANRETIFEAFFTTKRNQGGSGLGLAVTRSLLKAYKGSIELLPSSGGAVFEIKLRKC